MKVEFLRPGAGFGFGYSTGSVADLEDEQAEKLIEAGVVIPAKKKAKESDNEGTGEVEDASSKAKPEKAVKPKK